MPATSSSGSGRWGIAATAGDSEILVVPPAAPASADSDDVRVQGAQLGLTAPDKLEHASLSFTVGLMIGNPGAVGYDTKRQQILVPN